jgi:hypothetical protein
MFGEIIRDRKRLKIEKGKLEIGNRIEKTGRG